MDSPSVSPRARERGPAAADRCRRTPSRRDRVGGAAVRQAQIDALVRLVPATVAIQMLTAAVMVVGLRDTTDNFQLGLWFGAALLLCFTRGVRAVRLRHDPEYAEQHIRRSTGAICLLIACWPRCGWCRRSSGSTPAATEHRNLHVRGDGGAGQRRQHHAGVAAAGRVALCRLSDDRLRVADARSSTARRCSLLAVPMPAC